MYKDKHLQREANKRASQRQRDKKAGMTLVPDKGMTNQGMTAVNEQPGVIPKEDRIVIPLKPDNSIDVVKLRQMKPERTAKGNIRVSKPGDADYDGVLS